MRRRVTESFGVEPGKTEIQTRGSRADAELRASVGFCKPLRLTAARDRQLRSDDSVAAGSGFAPDPGGSAEEFCRKAIGYGARLA